MPQPSDLAISLIDKSFNNASGTWAVEICCCGDTSINVTVHKPSTEAEELEIQWYLEKHVLHDP
jgi:hypothetical protein